jgi:hypothetical protein
MNRDPSNEFEARLRRQLPAAPPPDLRGRVLARAASAPESAPVARGKGASAGGLAVAAVVIVALAVVINGRIESAAPGAGQTPAQPMLVTVPSPVPGLPSVVMFQPRQAPPITREAFLKERAQLEALLKS